MGTIKYVNLSRDVPAGTRINKTENRQRAPCKGIVTEFIIYFPSGTDNLLGVFCGVNQLQLAPINGEIRMSETTVRFPVNEPVDRDDYIWAGLINYSSENEYRAEVYAGIDCETCFKETWNC